MPTIESRLAEIRSRLDARDDRRRVESEAGPTDAERTRYDWTRFARPDQLRPPGDWRTAAWICGRGFGKTRVLSEEVRREAESDPRARIALVAATAADARDVLVEGESGVLACSPPWFMPRYEPSKRKLTWPNGAQAFTYSAEESDRLRGPQHSFAACDEAASWWDGQHVWDMLVFGLRLGRDPRAIVATTPRPTKFIRDLIAHPSTVTIRGSTWANRDNLPPVFLEAIKARYGDTRLGRQEIDAEVLEVGEHIVFISYLPARNVARDAAYNPMLPTAIAVDCGTSRTTAAVWYQAHKIDQHRTRIHIVGEYVHQHGAGSYATAGAQAIASHSARLGCHAPAGVLLDPFGQAETSAGPAAQAAYEVIFGSRIVSRWTRRGLHDSIQDVNHLLDKGDLLIAPSCVRTQEALAAHSWKLQKGVATNTPSDEHPYADLCDAVRGTVCQVYPGGIVLPPTNLRTIRARGAM